jgi:malonyl-CoA O-methyltransferase
MNGFHDRIKRQFNCSARDQYDRNVSVQLRMAEALESRLYQKLADMHPYKTDRSPQALEIGCGTGAFTASLARMLPAGRITALDLSSAMLDAARLKLSIQCPEAIENSRIRFIEANVEKWACEQLQPLVQERYSLIASNACFQWFVQPERTIAALYGLLSKGGLLAFTTFGPGTMRELHASFEEAYRRIGQTYRHHGLSFHSLEQWQAMLHNAGFQLVDAISKEELETHRSVKHFLHSVKAIGAGASEASSHPEVVGIQRRLFREMFQAYEANFPAVNGEGIIATYETLTLIAIRNS